MKRAFKLLLILSLLCPLFSNAQPVCGFDRLHTQALETDSAFARRMSANSHYLRQYIDAHPELRSPGASRGAALYTIPVVVHVMHTGGAVGTIYNPSDARIMEAIDYLNDVYAGTHPGMATPSPGGAAGDMEIQFALAQRTPSCGATNGINRVNASVLTNYVTNGINATTTTGVPEQTLKDLARWDPAQYYNIWIVNRIDGADGTSGQFIAGFAWFPGASPLVDGTVMLATQMQAGEKTLPHEIGHALNLHHPFYPSNNATQCPPAGPCGSTGDEVCDTDPIFNNVTAGVYSFACRTGNNTCTTGPVLPYTANTESNFMSYTNCYTLFTNGQKTRVQAAMTLPSRAGLVNASNLALVPCGTSINFATTMAARTEDIAGTLTGCRRYRDYTYQMTIGAGPTAAATAMLSFSGTAIKGLDYEVTTNGDFITPNSVLNFPAGSTAAQPFTVRVYDDAAVETQKTVVIDFTVNDGGGDALKGVTSPTFTITISDNDNEPTGPGTIVTAIGTLSATVANQVPFDATLNRQRSQYIYRASELTAAGITAGNLNELQLHVATKATTRPFASLTIRMGHTNVANLYDDPSLVAIGGLTTVFSAASYSTVAGWNSFALSTPFSWDGTSNIAVEICYNNVTTNAASGRDEVSYYSDGGSATQGNAIYRNGIDCSTAFSTVNLFTNGYKPVIRLARTQTPTPVETVAGSVSSGHIETGSNDYFYSNNNRLMMRVNSVDAPLGCVNVNLVESGTAWINYQGGQRSAKVFAVTATTNSGTTNYTAAFYFNNAELGGKNPATLRIAKTTAATIAAANSANTVVFTPTVTTLGTDITIFTASFTGFSSFFLVDAAVALPVDLLDFYGNINDQKDHVLHWITASEHDNRGFDVELSRNGQDFVSLNHIPSVGNSTVLQRYEYLHLKPMAGSNWYRLKQTDIDGRISYSKIVHLFSDRAAGRAFVYPIPARNTVTVNFGTMVARAEIELFSADMKLIQRDQVSALSLKKDLNISQLAPGVYFIRITTEGRQETVRFAKEK